MARTGSMMYVYNHAEQMHGHPHEPADPDVLDFVGQDFDRPGRNYPLRGSAPSPPPPYEPISYPLASPLPTPTFPAPYPTTVTIADAHHLRPAPPRLLDDRSFSPDPRDNPHFIMTSDERFLAASPPPPRDPASMRQIPPSLQPGRPMVPQTSSPHRRSHSSPHMPPNPAVPPKEYRPVPPSQSGSPPSMSRRVISASSMLPQNAVWRPPVTYASSTESGSSTSSHSSFVQHTPGASPPSSPASSPRTSFAPTTSSVSIHDLPLAEDTAPPVPPLPGTAEVIVTIPPPPVRVAAPPRTSSYGLPRPRTPAQAPVPIPGASASMPPGTARPSQPIHNHSAPELRVPPPPPPALARSATAPPRPAPAPPADPAQRPQRSQTQRGEQEHRGRSREQHSGQAVQRQRSRRPSITAPRDLDRIDELDETDPRGLAWHHESPYELVTRTLSHKRQDAADHNGGNDASRSGRQRPHKKPSMSFSVEPGQIFPSAALYQAMQPPYRPQAPSAAHHPPPFDPYGQDQLAFPPGAPSLPPTNPPPADAGKLRKSPSRVSPTQPPSQGSYQQTGSSRSPHASPPQPPPTGQLPALPTEAAQPPFQPAIPVRPPLQERPSQRSHVRFESPSRPDVRPPLKQGSVDEAYDGIEGVGFSQPPVAENAVSLAQLQPPVPPSTQNALPPRRPPPPPEALPPAPSQKPQPRPGPPQSRPSSMYLATSQSQSDALRPDIALPPRRPAPSVQTQASLPPRHVPKQLVMPAPLQPLEEQRKAEAARVAQQHRAQAIPQERRSEEGPARHPDIHTHGGRHMLHHSVSHRLPPVTQPPERQDLSRSASQGQSRTQVVPMSGGPNVLRKRSVMNASTPLVGPEAAPSSHTAAMFAARVFDDKRKGKTVERVSSGVWSRDPVKEAEIQRELAGEYKQAPKMGRKLSKLTRKLR